MRENTWILTAWGVRGSVPTAPADRREYGGGASCFSVEAGDELVIFDAGSGLVRLGERLRRRGGSRRIHLLLGIHGRAPAPAGAPGHGVRRRPGPLRQRNDGDTVMREGALRKPLEIGVMPSAERDLNRLPEYILERVMGLSNCGAGTLCLLEDGKLSILETMAEKEGKLDPALTRLFIESRCWETPAPVPAERKEARS